MVHFGTTTTAGGGVTPVVFFTTVGGRGAGGFAPREVTAIAAAVGRITAKATAAVRIALNFVIQLLQLKKHVADTANANLKKHQTL